MVAASSCFTVVSSTRVMSPARQLLYYFAMSTLLCARSCSFAPSLRPCGAHVATPSALFEELRVHKCSSIEFRADKNRRVPLSWAAADVVELAHLIRNHPTLHKIDLAGSVLGDENAILLAPGLGAAVENGCREINLANVRLSDDGLVAVGQAVMQALGASSELPSLRLYLGGNLITDAGAAAIIGFTLLHLDALDLSGNQLTDKAAWGIAAGVSTRSSLRRLNLSENNLGSDVIKALLALRNRDGDPVDVHAEEQHKDSGEGVEQYSKEEL
eukprot:COSAG02_NODE_1271_length_13526_cov_6.207865_3_plen_272_part_00